MHYLRNVALLGAVGLGAAVLASPALAARPGALPNTVGSTNFLVHFQSDPTTTFAITQTQAGDIATLAERAYSAYIADGYPAPPSDGGLGGDSRIDFYVVDLSTLKLLGEADPDTGGSPTTAFIKLGGTTPETSFDQHTIAHELFHVFQYGIWNSAQASDYWLYEGSAEWMGYRVDGYGGVGELGPDDMALDCRDPNGLNACDLSNDNNYKNNGYSRWPFFEYLGEKYGYSFVKDIFAQGAGGAPSATAALANAIAAKGTTLADVYDAWSTAQMTHSYSVKPLQSQQLTGYGSAQQTGTKTAALPALTVSVNHLATRYVEFQRGDGGDGSAPCYAATLSLTVTMPAGTSSKPAFYWNGPGSSPVALSINGNTASASVPWDTCIWPATDNGFLSLPNASTAVDSAAFVVSSSLTINTAQPANPGTAPDPVSTWGQVIPVTSASVPPAITVYGPELLKLSANDKQIRLIVESNGEGSLRASLGSIALGTGSLRPGNNDLRFTLPPSLLKALRRAAATSNVLTLTPVSADGATTGTAVTRAVSLPQAKATAKPKAKPKPKSKPKSHGK